MTTGVESLSNTDLESIPTTMNACLFYGPHDVRYERIPMPEISEGEILIKVNTALTCGTDLKTFQRSHPKLIKSIPSTFGHQFSGTVAKIGKGVEKFEIGERVVALNSAPCFQCEYCKRKQFSLCENIEFLNGAYAEYVAVPERIVKYNTYVIPPSVDFESAAALESLAVVLHGFSRAEITKEKTVCVIGSGSIGLMFVMLAKLHGVKVISIGRKDYKLKIAKKLGADHILNLTSFENNEELIQKIKELTRGNGPDVVIEAVGNPDLWELATRIVRKGGLVNFFGGCKKGTKVELDTYRLHYDELKLLGVFHHTPEYVEAALDLLKKHRISSETLKKIMTHTMPLKALKEALLMHESGEAIQVAIKPWGLLSKLFEDA